MVAGEVANAQKLGFSQETVHLLGYWAALDAINVAYKIAQDSNERLVGVPTCVRGCGVCCKNAVPLAIGVEAEYVSSWAVGQDLLPDILDRCRDWLTRGRYTMGTKVNSELWESLRGEFTEALSERCPFLKDDMDCLIHWARPSVCRAYGVTHLPDYWCTRPTGIGESRDAQVTFDAMTPSNPVKSMWDRLRASIVESRFSREGFLPLMIFERFKPDELAGLMDDGKVPIVKHAIRWGTTNLCLWQEDYENAISYRLAEKSIKDKVRMRERNGRLVQVGGDEMP